MLFYDLNTGRLCQGIQMGLLPDEKPVGPLSNINAVMSHVPYKPRVFDDAHFNTNIAFPYGLTVDHIKMAMEKFMEFLGVTNAALTKNHMAKLEDFMMPANFSSLVGEFMVTSLSKDSGVLVKNHFSNGHPDLVPFGHYGGNRILHGEEGVEIKASKNNSGWCGHNCEKSKLLIYIFDINPFQFNKVLFASLEKDDWNFSGRGESSRRTATASINKKGKEKLENGWVYRRHIV